MRAIGDRVAQGSTLNNMGLVYDPLGNYEKALDYHNQALEIREEIGDLRGQGMSLHNIASLLYRLGDYHKAIEYNNRALKIRKEIGDRRGQGITLNNIGFIFDYLGDYRKAFENYVKALRIQKEIGDRWGEAVSLTNIGFLHGRRGENQTALEYFTRSLKIRTEIGDRRGQAITLNCFGMVYTELNERAKMRGCLARAQKLAREIREKDVLLKNAVLSGGALLAEAVEKKAEKHIKNAEACAREALKLADGLRSKSGRAEGLLLMARIDAAECMEPPCGDQEHHSRISRQRSEGEFKEAIAIFEKLKQPFDIARAYYYYARSKAHRAESMEFLKKAKGIFKRLGAKGWLAKLAALDEGQRCKIAPGHKV
jgi:tetratricopeptide (TPR) repeat protein